MDLSLELIRKHAKVVRDQLIQEKSPKGWEGTVLAMKKHKDITNPWALAYSMKNKGEKSHYTKSGKKKGKK
jgi:hypothetical protein